MIIFPILHMSADRKEHAEKRLNSNIWITLKLQQSSRMTVISTNREDNWPRYILTMKKKARVKETLSSWHIKIIVLKFVMLVSVSRTGLLTQSLIVFSGSFCTWAYMPGIILHVFCGSEFLVKTLISKVWRAQRICFDSSCHCPTIYLAS